MPADQAVVGAMPTARRPPQQSAQPAAEQQADRPHHRPRRRLEQRPYRGQCQKEQDHDRHQYQAQISAQARASPRIRSAPARWARRPWAHRPGRPARLGDDRAHRDAARDRPATRLRLGVRLDDERRACLPAHRIVAVDHITHRHPRPPLTVAIVRRCVSVLFVGRALVHSRRPVANFATAAGCIAGAKSLPLAGLTLEQRTQVAHLVGAVGPPPHPGQLQSLADDRFAPRFHGPRTNQPAVRQVNGIVHAMHVVAEVAQHLLVFGLQRRLARR